MNINQLCPWPSCSCQEQKAPCKFDDPDWHINKAREEAKETIKLLELSQSALLTKIEKLKKLAASRLKELRQWRKLP